jgi:flagellin
MVAAINAVSDATGVSATLSSNPAAGLRLYSQDLGSRQFVSVQALPGGGTFSVQDVSGVTVTRDEGRDASALVNGALSVGDGNRLLLKTATLDLDVTLADTFGTGSTSFAITQGGALFQVGPEVNSNLQVNLGVRSMHASRLGNTAIGFLSQVQSEGGYSLIRGRYREAQAIVGEALDQVNILRGRLGAFEKNTLDTNVNQLGITMENLTAAESTIRDADFAEETSNLARHQILVNAGTTVLALAQQSPQNILRLLG